jgi:hypothetical protein
MKNKMLLQSECRYTIYEKVDCVPDGPVMHLRVFQIVEKT